jgi:predicted alpha/beta hydrolase family esterase
MTHYLIVPGLGNSGPEHWQTYFEQSGPHFSRIQQEEWDAPECEAWINRIEEKVSEFDPEQVVLVGHSLGCTAIAHWAKRFGRKIKGAMLVAPSDIENPIYTFPAVGFSPIPLKKIPFPTLVVASTDDPWVSFERAVFFASAWGSEFVSLGPAGHINVASGHTTWDEGLELLKRLG